MTHMHMPEVKFDWTINVSNLIAIVVLISAVATAWYDLKSEVIVNKNTADLKFQIIDRALIQQDSINQQTDAHISTASADMKQALRDSTSDIKSDIRELQSEVIKSQIRR